MLNWISNDEAGDSDSDEDEQVEINLESFGRALENRLAVAYVLFGDSLHTDCSLFVQEWNDKERRGTSGGRSTEEAFT